MPALESIRKLVEAASLGNTKAVDRGTDFSRIGLDSMDMVAMVAAIEQEFGISIDVDPSMAFRKVGDVLDYLDKEHGIR